MSDTQGFGYEEDYGGMNVPQDGFDETARRSSAEAEAENDVAHRVESYVDSETAFKDRIQSIQGQTEDLASQAIETITDISMAEGNQEHMNFAQNLGRIVEKLFPEDSQESEVVYRVAKVITSVGEVTNATKKAIKAKFSDDQISMAEDSLAFLEFSFHLADEAFDVVDVGEFIGLFFDKQGGYSGVFSSKNRELLEKDDDKEQSTLASLQSIFQHDEAYKLFLRELVGEENDASLEDLASSLEEDLEKIMESATPSNIEEYKEKLLGSLLKTKAEYRDVSIFVHDEISLTTKVIDYLLVMTRKKQHDEK